MNAQTVPFLINIEKSLGLVPPLVLPFGRRKIFPKTFFHIFSNEKRAEMKNFFLQLRSNVFSQKAYQLLNTNRRMEMLSTMPTRAQFTTSAVPP